MAAALIMTSPQHERRPNTRKPGDHSARAVGPVRAPSKQRAAGQPTGSYTVSVVGDIPPDLADRVAHAHAKAMLTGGSLDRASRAAKQETKAS